MFFNHLSALDYKSMAESNIKSKITKLQNLGKPEEDFLYASINDWLESDHRKFMLKAQEYYGNDNEINERKRYYIDRKGFKKEIDNLSNSKLSHPFMRKLTNQKVNRLLSKPFSIQTSDGNDGFSALLATYFNDNFMRLLKRIGKDAITNGIAWVQVYYNDAGELKFKRIPAEEIIPFWTDADHTELEAIIRTYSVMTYLPNGVKQEIQKVEYYTTNGVWYYIVGAKGLEPDPDRGNGIQGHFQVQQPMVDKEGNPQVDKDGNLMIENVHAAWEKVPFVAFKYNVEETSLLKWVKSLIDDYDINTSDTSNNLQDIPNSVKVVKGYDGTDKEEFTHNLNVYRTAFVAGDGDMKTLETPLDVQAIDSHLNRLRKDIFDGGCGVDMQEANLGTASGIALKLRFSDLDADVADISTEFQASLEALVWFIKIDLVNKGAGDFTDIDVEFIFNTDTIVNEEEVIKCAKESVGIISNETIVANHPWVTNAQVELERLAKERAEAIKEAQQMMGDAPDNGFGTDNFNNNEEDTEEDEDPVKEE